MVSTSGPWLRTLKVGFELDQIRKYIREQESANRGRTGKFLGQQPRRSLLSGLVGNPEPSLDGSADVVIPTTKPRGVEQRPA